MSNTIESLELEIVSNSDSAAKGIDALAESLGKLKNATKNSGLKGLATDMGKLNDATNKMKQTNNKASKSFTDLFHVIKSGAQSIKKVTKILWSAIEKSMDYTENMNLFAVAISSSVDPKETTEKTTEAMKQAVTEAIGYAEQVSDAMGIDTSEWIRAQGVFQTLATGFGVAGDRATVMSTNLTQLGYDLASFYNMDVETAMLKLKSGLAGELEPLRDIGYDLSQAKLEATALELGITKSVSAMTQAEKAQLRYHAILTQVSTAHGDMARTIQDPANQMRIFKAEINKTAREIGNAFIPVLQAVLPTAIAVTKVIGELAKIIASLGGYEAEDPTERIMENTGTTQENLEGAQEEAKKLKNYMLGFDELNVINSDTGSALEDASGWVDFDLQTYEFLPEGMKNDINDIVDKMKEWLGITDEIDSWAELFDTRLGGILKTVGAIGIAFLTWKVVAGVVDVVTSISTTISKISNLFGKGKSSGDKSGDVATASSKISETTTKLKGLVQNLALGIVVIAEVIAAAALIVGGIWLLGVMLEQVGIAWQPVIDNGVNVLAALGLGTAVLALVGVGTALLGSVGTTLIVNLALGIAMLALVGVASALFIAEIIVVGLLLDEVGKAWQPVIDNGETITNAILIGTGLLIGIGVVAALLGVASVATAGLLPVAIGLGTIMLILLTEAFVGFTDNLVTVANQLSEYLHPALDKASAILPDVTKNMSDFTVFMGDFAGEVVKFSISGAISGISSTIGTIIGFFTGDPIESMTKEVESQNNQFDKLIAQLEKAIPKINKAINLTRQYNTAMSNYGNISGGNGGTLSSFFSGIGDAIGSLFRGSSATNSAVSVSIPAYASGGFPEQGQMFIAREAGAEMVGNIGRRTAVANNDQIVASISGGVAEANEEQNGLLREQNALLRAILEKDSGVYLDGKNLANSVEKYQRERGRVLITGGVI